MTTGGMKKYAFATNGISKEESVISGEKYRISMLTPSLIRLEYNESGVFEDRATQCVVNRAFKVPQYRVNGEIVDGIEWLTVETEKLKLRYDRKKFSKEGLQIQVKELEEAVWHYCQELKDLKGTYRTLDGYDGDRFIFGGKKMQLGHGILSREGFSVIDDSHSMALTDDGWVEPRQQCIDIYFFGYGHRYLEALHDFYQLCGKTPLLPRYALGNWWSRYYRYTEAEYKKLMLRFEQEQLPFSVAVLDMDWHLVDDVDPKYGRGWTGYTWNKKFFPDPEGFMRWLHDRNLKVTLNVHPADGVRAFEEIYPKMAEAMGIDVGSEQPVEFDPADPDFMEKYFDILCHNLEKQGVDFWWIDWQQGEESKMPGLDPLWILNHFHYLDSAWKGNRPMTFSRYAGVGSHRYPIGFSGDTTITWNSLAYQPYFTNTASNIGYGWWSHDIGGHNKGARDDELMARWIQYGVFSPINRLHSATNLFSGKEPWKYDIATRDVMNRYLRLRHGLIPYLYTMNRRASRENLPLIQPMYYLEPEQEETYQVPNEYYFGTELLVSPITTPGDKVSKAGMAKTWLPEGLWADFFDGMVYKGGRMTELWRGIENMPVMMKAGAIVPMKNMELYDNSVENPQAMEVRIFPASDGLFTLWEDGGDTQTDEDSNWASTKLQWSMEPERMIENATVRAGVFTISGAKGNLSIIPEKRSWKLVFCAVENSGETMAESVSAELMVNGCRQNIEVSYDEETFRMIVNIPEVEVTKEIKVIFSKGLNIVDNFKEQCFKILLRAQMAYNIKAEIWKVICDSTADRIAVLDDMEIDASVKACLLEILTACAK